MRFLLVILGIFGLWGRGATVDVPLDLARSAQAWCLLGVDLALPDLATNPGGLPFAASWHLCSTFSSTFGVVRVWAISLSTQGFGAEAVLVDGGEIGPNLHYRVWAGRAGAGLRLGQFGLGGQVRVLRPEQPKALLGGALDLGFFWAGPVYVGILAESLVSFSPYPHEGWPPDLSLAAAWRGDLGRFSGTVGVGFMDLLSLPAWALAGALDFGSVELRLGLRATALSLGGSVESSWFALDWVFTLHPALPLSFRVSFTLR